MSVRSTKAGGSMAVRSRRRHWRGEQLESSRRRDAMVGDIKRSKAVFVLLALI